MTALQPPSIRLLVCGNGDRGDDGAALAAVAGLLPTLPRTVLDRVEVRRCPQLDVTDLADLPDGVSAVVVDTAVGIAPGQVVVLPLRRVARSGDGPAPYSSHALPPQAAIRLAANIRGKLPQGSFVGVGGRSFAFGRPLSAPVRAAMPRFRRALEAELARLAER
ncbi:MAG TPA: hydrogenase maturation protease [Candidatus Limnocylindrales bacterium]|jgi:hydrogenase maturation protease